MISWGITPYILGIIVLQERGTINQPVYWNDRGIWNTAHLEVS
jgi:hypothetical protein